MPVLSKAKADTSASFSRADPPLTKTPVPASRPKAAKTAAGVAKISAQGQATTKTAKVGSTLQEMASARLRLVPARIPRFKNTAPANVRAANPKTAGRKYRARRSAVRSQVILSFKAARVSSITRPTMVCSATRRASIVKAPNWFNVPARTSSPGPLSTGKLSPVRALASTADRPSRTTPSTGMRPPGLTKTRSPT